MTPQALGRKEGRLAAGQLWNTFLETSNPDDLPLSKASAHHLGADRAHAAGFESPAETEQFISAFATTVHAEIDRKIRALIPAKLRPRIHHFCMLAHWLKLSSTYHPEEAAASHFGLGLHVPGRKLTVHPASVDSVSRRRGRVDARSEWKAFLERPEPLPARLHWSKAHRELAAEQAFHADYDFPEAVEFGTPTYGKLVAEWKRGWSDAYKKEIAAKIKAWIPARLRKFYGHVCALADRLGLHVPKMVALPGSRGDAGE